MGRPGTIAVDPEQPRRFALTSASLAGRATRSCPGACIGSESRREPVVSEVNGQRSRWTDERLCADRRVWRRGDVSSSSCRCLSAASSPTRAWRRRRPRGARAGPAGLCGRMARQRRRRAHIVVPDEARLRASFAATCSTACEVITGNGQRSAARRRCGAARAAPLVAIPYYAWANRGMGEMQVWLPRGPTARA